MTLQGFEERLKGVCPEVSHFHARCPEAPYIVWGEDGQADSVRGDDAMEEQAIQGTVDLFTKTEYDPLTGKVQTALDEAGAAWRLNSVQYEDDTGLYHYEWVWALG